MLLQYLNRLNAVRIGANVNLPKPENWLLITGLWQDSQRWVDTELWID